MSEPNVPAEVAAAESAVAAPNCACTSFAVVNAAGGLVRGCGATSAQRLAQGVYEVLFTGNVESCAWVATIGLDNDGVPPRGGISVAGVANPNGARVTTYNCDCELVDRPFHLTVHCCPEKDGD